MTGSERAPIARFGNKRARRRSFAQTLQDSLWAKDVLCAVYVFHSGAQRMIRLATHAWHCWPHASTASARDLPPGRTGENWPKLYEMFAPGAAHTVGPGMTAECATDITGVGRPVTGNRMFRLQVPNCSWHAAFNWVTLRKKSQRQSTGLTGEQRARSQLA